MIPFNSPLERAQAYEIVQLTRELAYYRDQEKSRNIVSVFHNVRDNPPGETK